MRRSKSWNELRLHQAPGARSWLSWAFPRARTIVSLEGVDLLASGILRRVTTETLFAGLHELFGPRVEVVGLDPFTATQLVDCDLATESFKDYADLFF